MPSRKVSDESLGRDETSFVRLATKLSQVNVEIIVNKGGGLFLKRKVGVTERPRSLNPSKAIAMAICPIIVHFSTWRARSMHDVASEFARAAVCSKDAQKQLARTSLNF